MDEKQQEMIDNKNALKKRYQYIPKSMVFTEKF